MITGWVGWIGHGKTMLAVDQARKLAREWGALMASNIKIEPPAGVDFTQLPVGADGFDFDVLMELIGRAQERDEHGHARGLVVLLDEVGVLMPARAWQSFPVYLDWALSQSRKVNLELIWTAQFIDMVDKHLRDLTQVVNRVRAWPGPRLMDRRRGRRPLLFRVTMWRPSSIDKRDARLDAKWIRYRREREAWYDTDELVMPAERLKGAENVSRASAARGRVRRDRGDADRAGAVDRVRGGRPDDRPELARSDGRLGTAPTE